MENKHLPEIRFEGFTGDWEQCKVFVFAEETYGGGTPKTSVDEYWNGNLSWIQSSDLNEHQVSNIQAKKKITEHGLIKSAAKLVPANSIAIVTRVGVGKLAYMPFEYATSQDFLSLSKLKVDAWFAVYSLYKKLQRELNAVQGTSIKGITKKELLDKRIMVPIKVEEQIKIGNFFKQLDDTITLHQRKLDKLKEMKKGFLQKMFPKKGESVPEIRFAGFTDAWEQRKFADLVARVSKSSEEDVLPRVEYEDIISGLGELNKDIFAKESTKKGIEFEIGDTLFGKLRPYLQNWLLADFKGIAVGDWWVLRPDEMNSEFIYSLIQSSKYQIVANLSTGTKMPRSDWNVVSQTKFPVPINKEEQARVGQFFSGIDQTITLHQRKLDKLKEMKKGFLQKMFV